MKILLIEDDATTADYVEKGLRQAGHEVDRAGDGRDGLLLASSNHYDAAVVDRMVPGLDGLALVKTLRSAGVKVPILFLTALGGIDERVEGLEAGADDYLGKPFAFSELMARLNALARRPPMAAETTTLQVGDLVMDLVARTVRWSCSRVSSSCWRC
jgi:two-component system OmpR family response regulator